MVTGWFAEYNRCIRGAAPIRFGLSAVRALQIALRSARTVLTSCVVVLHMFCRGADQHVLAHVAAGAGHALESDTVTADRVSSTYAYLMASLGITAASAWLSFTSGLSASICALNPWAVFGLMLLSGFTFVWGTLNTSIKSNPVIKHMLWAGLGASTGIWLGVVGYFSSAIVLKATLATACLLGGLSTVGYFSPTGTHRWMSGPLSVGLGLMCGASIAQFVRLAHTHARGCPILI